MGVVLIGASFYGPEFSAEVTGDIFLLLVPKPVGLSQLQQDCCPGKSTRFEASREVRGACPGACLYVIPLLPSLLCFLPLFCTCFVLPTSSEDTRLPQVLLLPKSQKHKPMLLPAV